jgi:SNF2 family DNA or RNA helicase
VKTLDDYQDVSRDFLLQGGLTVGLFDEQGVGKTPPAIIAAGKRIDLTNRRALVTGPAYLLPQWAQAIHEFLPGATTQIINADGITERTKQFNTSADFILTSYHNWANVKKRNKQLVGLNYPMLQKGEWSTYLFDEAHRMRGRNNIWTKMLHQVRNVDMPRHSRETPMWFLTGTPIVRNGGDLWPILYLKDRQAFRSYWTYVERWCKVEDTPFERIVGDVRNPEEFQRMLDGLFLRRKLKDIPSLASLKFVPQDIPVRLPASVYNTIRAAKKTYTIDHPDLDTPEAVDGAGALFTKLWQLTTAPPTQANPKLDALKGYLEDHTERVVVWNWFRDSATNAADMFRKAFPKRPFGVFTGDTSARRKIEILELYTNVPDYVIFATVGALKEGANLQAGRDMVFLEEPVLPDEREQCIARQMRRGQPYPVRVASIYAEASPDTEVRKIQQRTSVSVKKAMQEYLVDAE